MAVNDGMGVSRLALCGFRRVSPAASELRRSMRLTANIVASLGTILLAGAPCSGALAATRTAGAQGDECPMARESYSTRTPLFDLLIDPAARAVLERDAPQLLKSPFGVWSTQIPSFATILSPHHMFGAGAAAGTNANANANANIASRVAALDAALARVRVTAEASRRRCARYDREPPALPRDLPRPAILVYEKITGFHHPLSPEAAAEALREMAARRGWSIVFTNNAAVFDAGHLARFDAVVWNNVSGDGLTLGQRAAFRGWIEAGGGFAGLHATGGDPVYFWDWFADELLAARFTGHPIEPQLQDARVVIEDRQEPITAGLGGGWTMKEEWYSFASSPRARGARILATLDESTYRPPGGSTALT